MKIGYCCKTVDKDGVNVEGLNSKSTTLTYLKKQSKKDQSLYLENIIEYNLKSLYDVFESISNKDPILRMFRMSSDIFPFYSHETMKPFWKQKNIQNKLREGLIISGKLAKDKNIRLSFHPGQYTVLNSINDLVVDRAIDELEYHTDIARFLGFTNKFHERGFACNIHVGSKAGGIKNFRKNFKRLSNDCKKILTVENDEFSFGLDEFLELGDITSLVLDIHHHWCKTGEYIQNDDQRLDKVSQSWRGERPKLHYAHTRYEFIEKSKGLLDRDHLLNKLKVRDLRRHSDSYWNKEANQWALSFLDRFDIQCEAKNKNLAAEQLFKELKIKK